MINRHVPLVRLKPHLFVISAESAAHSQVYYQLCYLSGKLSQLNKKKKTLCVVD